MPAFNAARPVSLVTLATLALTAVGAPAASAAPQSRPSTVPARSGPTPGREVAPARELTTDALRQVLQQQPLPTTRLLPVTRASHPFNGAAWQNRPIDLARHGYTEREYLVSGRSNVYDWTRHADHRTRITAAGPYTTRLMVRMPADPARWSGKVNVEIINMTAQYDWTAIWSALWQRTLADGDAYVGITSKPNVFPALQAFDAKRYGSLSMANPLPATEQKCGLAPGAKGYDANLSKKYENGLIWDALSQTGRLLKSTSPANPLGRPARRIVLSGESQSANYLLTYYRYFTPAAMLADGRRIFDGYFAETQVGLEGAPIAQCATPLPVTDPQRGRFPDRPAPWMAVNSQWDYPGARRWFTPADANTSRARHAFWQLAGASHGWEWQYLYGDATAADLRRAGFPAPATYDWHCPADRPEVPVQMAEKAAYEHLRRWIESGTAPPTAPRILARGVTPGPGLDWSDAERGLTDRTVYDGLGNAMGGLRFPMVAAPVAGYGRGHFALTPGCREISPFPAPTLTALYPSRREYLRQYDSATTGLVRAGFVLREDAGTLRALARRVPWPRTR